MILFDQIRSGIREYQQTPVNFGEVSFFFFNPPILTETVKQIITKKISGLLSRNIYLQKKDAMFERIIPLKKPCDIGIVGVQTFQPIDQDAELQERCNKFCGPENLPVMLGTSSFGFNLQEQESICRNDPVPNWLLAPSKIDVIDLIVRARVRKIFRTF